MTFWKRYGWKITIIMIVILILSYLFFTINGFILTGLDLDKSNWLGFWAGYLSFAGALFLGAVALWQNEKANEINEKILKTQIITLQATSIRKYDTLKIIKSKRKNLNEFEIENVFCLNCEENNYESLYFEIKINQNGYTGDVPIAFRVTFLNIDPGEDNLIMRKCMHMKFTKAYFQDFVYNPENLHINFSMLYSKSDINEVKCLLECKTPELMFELEYLNAYNVLTTQTLFVDTEKIDDENYKIINTSIMSTNFSIKEQTNE